MHRTPSRGPVVAARSPPDDLVSEPFRPEDAIEHGFQVVARGRVAVQVETPGRLQEPVHVFQPFGHVGEVGEHAGFAEHAGQPDNGLVRRPRDRGPVPFQPFAGSRVPGPRVVERPVLRVTGRAGREQHAVVGVAVERRVQVDQIDGGIVPPGHPVEAVAVAETSDRRGCRHRSTVAAACPRPPARAISARHSGVRLAARAFPARLASMPALAVPVQPGLPLARFPVQAV